MKDVANVLAFSWSGAQSWCHDAGHGEEGVMEGPGARATAPQVKSLIRAVIWPGSLLLLFGLCGAVAVTKPAWSASPQEARENCRAAVGRSTIRACMQNREGSLGECRAQARARVQACINRALANARPDVPVAAPKEEQLEPLPEAKVEAIGFVAPPRTISDIADILDAEKPEAEKLAKLTAAAEATPPAGSTGDDLAKFYYDRGNARAELGRLSEAIADAEMALSVAHVSDDNLKARLEQFAGLQYLIAGDPKKALEIYSRQVRHAEKSRRARGMLFGGNRAISGIQMRLGDLEAAETALRRNLELIRHARTHGHPRWRRTYAKYGQSWEAEVELHRAMILEATGKMEEAEKSYRLAERRKRASLEAVLSLRNPPPVSQLLHGADNLAAGLARVLAAQGRLAEAEAEARRALLGRLKDQGKYHPSTPPFIISLAKILVEQGRYAEAERLAYVALDVSRVVGIDTDSQLMASVLLVVGSILSLQDKTEEAAAVFAELDRSIARWEPQRRVRYEFSAWRIHSLYASGRIEAGIAAAQTFLEREISRVGDKHYDTAKARGTLGFGYLKAGRLSEAVAEFKAAIPILIASTRDETGEDDLLGVQAHRRRLKNIFEGYIAALAASGAGRETAAETFGLADVIRGQSVQKAVSASSARLFANDPATADLIRSEQDLSKKMNAQLGALNNALALPSDQRDDQTVAALKASIGQIEAERDKTRADIIRRFPAYADLTDHRPPTIDGIRKALRHNEALLSFYFGRHKSFVWAVPKTGPLAFAQISATAAEIEAKVGELRAALEPKAAMIADIPPFDLTLAHQLYKLLLEPVEPAWKTAESLMVVTNGALGMLPLSLLPTTAAKPKPSGSPLFGSYRKVAWLARTHAVTTVPSAAALQTLRQLPPGPVTRESVVGFGDPFFSPEQAREAASGIGVPMQVASVDARGLPLRRRLVAGTRNIDNADLALLPRLPDTATELRAIARALRSDPERVLFLGEMANEQRVKQSDLSRYRVVAFSTHGLVPGDLDGLTQPALALSAPDVAGVEGDGLLTMEEILALKLDADWVVLSACNTGAGVEAGAAAASGLGRAFFYAGSRSLLVTNWSVHSASAAELVTGIFQRQAADPKLSRAKALQRSMLALMEGPGAVGADGRTEYTYAHPLFWAPYSIIGDSS